MKTETPLPNRLWVKRGTVVVPAAHRTAIQFLKHIPITFAVALSLLGATVLPRSSAGASAPVVVTSRSISSPVASDAVWIASSVTGTNSLASVSLSYTASIASGTASTAFIETFGKTAAKPWTSASVGLDNAWTVTGGLLELNTLSNDGNLDTATGSCGVAFKPGTSAARMFTSTPPPPSPSPPFLGPITPLSSALGATSIR